MTDRPAFQQLGIMGIDSTVAATIKAEIARASNAPLTMKELQGVALAGIRRTVNTMRAWGQGTPARKIKHVGGRKRVRLADGRLMHPTKGIGKTDKGGYSRQSRRSNRS